MKNTFWLLAAFLVISVNLSAQGIAGKWKTIDDETGKPKSHILLYESNNMLFGKVETLLSDASTSKCDKCSGERKNQPIVGMIIVENMELKDGYYQSGKILDPKKGKWYNCKMWLKEGDSNTLVVRGAVGPFYRTQYWQRIQ
ncbi:MAG: DUF2147 domain-containing protein [Saprospiraceae bacterium]|nr:DUF2147 domain-containing protein [Saprospiraceae bacterium]